MKQLWDEGTQLWDGVDEKTDEQNIFHFLFSIFYFSFDICL